MNDNHEELDIEQQIKENQHKLQELKKKKIEERDREINKVIRKWHDVLKTITPEEKEKGRFQLNIYPYAYAKHSNLQNYHYTKFTEYGEDVWKWNTYINCSDDSEPLTFRANSVEKLLPPHREDLGFLINSGMQLELKMPDLGVMSAWSELEKIFSEFGSRLKRMDGSTLSFRGSDARSHIDDMRELLENRAEFEQGPQPDSTPEDLKWFKKDFPALRNRVMKRERDLVDEFYGFENNPEAKIIHNKIKKVKKILTDK